MSALFEIVADQSRRELLRLVWRQERPVGELVDALELTQPTVSHHLKILREHALVDVRKDGNRRLYKARPEAFGSLKEYLETYWLQEANALKSLIESKRTAGKDDDS